MTTFVEMIFYFSATGNSRHVALRMAEETGERAISVDDCLKNNVLTFNVDEGERIGFVCPVYFWGIPEVMGEFIRRMCIKTCGAHYVYTIITYGTTTGQAGYLLKKALRRRGLKRNAHFAVRMVDTYTPMFDVSDKERCQEKTVRAERSIDIAAQRIKERKRGNHDRLRLYHPLAAIYTRMNHKPKTRPFSVSDRCMGCGLCAGNCPMHAISMANGRPTWTKDHCMTCLRCLHRCPAFAIQYGKHTASHGQFVYPERKQVGINGEKRAKSN